jgi:hypothetical protein
MTEIVVEQDGRIVGWIGLGTKARNGRTTIRLLVHPDHREIAPDLLRHAMGLAPAGTQLVTRVRDYQTETISVFLDAGFQVMAEEVLLVKHAHVVPAAAEKKRMRAVRIPSLPAIPTNLSVLSQPNGHEGQKT